MAWGSPRSVAPVATLATVIAPGAVMGLDGSTAVAARTGHRTTAASSKRYYVSLGDSYAVGFQPGRAHRYRDQIVTPESDG